MSSKFEQLLDYLVNEEQEKANELFHEIVVEKSREIYENLIAEEEQEEQEEETTESTEEDEEESVEEGMGCDEDETVETMFGEEEDEFPIQDKTDDLEGDVEDDEFTAAVTGDEGEDGSAPATKDDVQDLEDALEELKAEFEALLAQEEGEGHDMDAIDAAGDEAGDEGDEEGEEEEEEAFESSEEEEEAVKESKKSAGQAMREYIEKVAQTMTDGEGVGSGKGDLAGQTGHDAGKSPVSSGSGKPTSGANAKNIAQAEAGANEDGTSPKGKVGGLVKQGGQLAGAGTKNVTTSANSKKPDGAKLSSVSKPGNAEGKPVGAGTGQSNVSGATNTKSIESGN